jgi:hypothetical protein
LQGIKKRTYSLFCLRVLSWNESIGFDKKDRKETEEGKSKKGGIKIEIFFCLLFYGKQAPFQINSAPNPF